MFSSASRRAAAMLAALGLAAAVGCRPAASVRIGFLGDLITELGVGGRNGAELAVETLNARHGVHYELLLQDDRNDAKVARAAIASFAARGAAFVVGPMTSEMAVAAVPEANRRGVVLISPATPAVQSYEAVMLGVQAFDRRGADSLRATLSVPATWTALDGEFSLDAFGDARRALHLTQVRNGRFEPLR